MFARRGAEGSYVGPITNGHTVDVTVGPAPAFSPDSVTILVGDTVRWTWAGPNHTVTSGSPCTPDEQYCSPSDMSCGIPNTGNTNDVYLHTFNQPGEYLYFCSIHCSTGMTGTVEVIVPALISVKRAANGHFVIAGTSLPDSSVTVKSTSNLQTAFGSPQSVPTDGSGAFQYDDSSVIGATRQFYQVIF
ncbi:MAG: cupredoxin domain-containing protein [Chthoniobacterales bacterium]